MLIPPETWLIDLNRKFREQDVHVRRRPFLAIDHYCKDFNVTAVAFDSPSAKAIFDWFYANTKTEAHQIGTLFTGAFYFDSCFWPVDVLTGYGRYELNALESLQAMSEQLKRELMSIPEAAWAYALNWADSVDYGYGIDDLDKALDVDAIFARSLLENADRELRSAIAQLLERRPNAKAAMSCRMATEIFLKAFLVLKARFTEPQIRALSHNLDKLLIKMREIDPSHEALRIEKELWVFPAINDRYTGGELTPARLWQAYDVTLYLAASIVRSFTERNLRAHILSQQSPR